MAQRCISFSGRVFNPGEPCAAHHIRLLVDRRRLELTGTSHWRAHDSLGLAARAFVLRGRAGADGRVEFFDDTPERLPGFRRGVYIGCADAQGHRLRGQYYEIDEQARTLFYWGDWTATRQNAGGHGRG